MDMPEETGSQFVNEGEELEIMITKNLSGERKKFKLRQQMTCERIQIRKIA